MRQGVKAGTNLSGPLEACARPILSRSRSRNSECLVMYEDMYASIRDGGSPYLLRLSPVLNQGWPGEHGKLRGTALGSLWCFCPLPAWLPIKSGKISSTIVKFYDRENQQATRPGLAASQPTLAWICAGQFAMKSGVVQNFDRRI